MIALTIYVLLRGRWIYTFLFFFFQLEYNKKKSGEMVERSIDHDITNRDNFLSVLHNFVTIKYGKFITK